MSEAAGASEPTTLQFDAATLSSVARLANMGVWRMDCTSPLQTLHWDEMSYQLHGTDRERFQPTLGGSLLLYEDESRSRLEDALMACSVSNTPFEVEVDRRLDNGRTRRLLVAGTAQAGGREILGYYQDVSDRKQLVNRLQLEQSQTRALFRTLPDLMYAVDAGGFFREYYTGQSSLLMQPPESYVGRHISEAFPYLRQEFPPKLRHACESGEITSLEFQLHHNDRDGTFEVRILPLEKGGDHAQKAFAHPRYHRAASPFGRA